MDINKTGATRTALIFKNFVIKIPRLDRYDLFLHGILANLQERLWSGHHNGLAKVMYCPKNGLFLIMEHVKDITDTGETELLETLTLMYKDDDLKEFMLSDYKISNWGKKDGRYLKRDYGN